MFIGDRRSSPRSSPRPRRRLRPRPRDVRATRGAAPGTRRLGVRRRPLAQRSPGAVLRRARRARAARPRRRGWGRSRSPRLPRRRARSRTPWHPLLGGLTDRRGRLYPIRCGARLPRSSSASPASRSPSRRSRRSRCSRSPARRLVRRHLHARDRPRLRPGRGRRAAQGLAFGVMNTAWASGLWSGPTVGGALADALGDAAPYLLCAASPLRGHARADRRRVRLAAAAPESLASAPRSSRASAGNRSSAQAASSGRRR